jgi:hypothetical protein
MSDDTTNPDEECKNFQAAYESGDRAALWGAIVFCAAHRIPNWEWLANEIVAIQRAAESGKIEGWNDVFGQILNEGQHRGAQTRSRRFEIYLRISDARAKVRKARDELAAARGALPKLPSSVMSGGADASLLGEVDRSEEEAAALVKANAAYREARKELADAEQAEKKAWDGFGLSRKSVQRFFYRPRSAKRHWTDLLKKKAP